MSTRTHRTQDAHLHRSLRLTIVGTISLIALAALVLCYQALFEVIGFDFPAAGMRLGWGVLCVIAALLLIRYKGDLVDD
jgi:hypothetical protein